MLLHCPNPGEQLVSRRPEALHQFPLEILAVDFLLDVSGGDPIHHIGDTTADMGFHPFQIAFETRALPEPRMEGCQSVEQRTNVVRRDLLRDVREPGVPRRQIFKHQSERSEEHTSELQSLMRISYAVFCLKKKTKPKDKNSCKIRRTMDKVRT